jgi:hypothetical protein
MMAVMQDIGPNLVAGGGSIVGIAVFVAAGIFFGRFAGQVNLNVSKIECHGFSCGPVTAALC